MNIAVPATWNLSSSGIAAGRKEGGREDWAEGGRLDPAEYIRLRASPPHVSGCTHMCAHIYAHTCIQMFGAPLEQRTCAAPRVFFKGNGNACVLEPIYGVIRTISTFLSFLFELLTRLKST